MLQSCVGKFNDKQHGFRKLRSCQTAVSVVTDDIYRCLHQRNGKCIAAFIDFRKAFDSLNREILLNKLMNKFKIPLYLLRILCSYYSDRSFRIINGSNESQYFNIDNGSGPGSCVGPLAFTLFINDITNAIIEAHVLYADDIVIYVDGTNFQEGVKKMQASLKGAKVIIYR